MKKIKIEFIITSLALLFLTTNSFANGLPLVSASIFKNSCGYYSSTNGNFLFQYIEQDPSVIVEGNQKVTLIYGLIGFDGSPSNTIDWQHRKEVPMKMVSSGHWEVLESVNLHSRGSSYLYNKIGFVVRTEDQNGVFYDNGRQSSWGSYEIDFDLMKAPCIDNKTVSNQYKDLTITIHNKN